MKTLVICSGGLDSVTLAYKIARERTLIGLIGFDYGQRHKKELEYSKACAESLGVPYTSFDISGIGKALSGSALTDDIAVPEGYYAEENMRVTVVPNRNAIMLSIAYGVGAACGAEAVAAAFHGGDHYIYPDCRPGFVEAFQAMQDQALEGVADIRLYTPFVTISKAGIVEEGARLGVPFEKTWSCYKGEEKHCGRCGTCVARREAFHLAGVSDPTEYADPDFWQAAVEGAKKGEAA
ncbi:MAG: 7-cyano-7-deazaguanine synthase QueC [Alphaproteobacteria bacterium]|nr:7-cyano-7-deazaguanine synthase QueC [Alphaproteobacteria bacterium]